MIRRGDENLRMRSNRHPVGLRAAVVGAALTIMAMVSCSQMNDRGERDSRSATAASRSSPCALSPEALTERMEGDLQQLADASREVLELSDGLLLGG